MGVYTICTQWVTWVPPRVFERTSESRGSIPRVAPNASMSEAQSKYHGITQIIPDPVHPAGCNRCVRVYRGRFTSAVHAFHCKVNPACGWDDYAGVCGDCCGDDVVRPNSYSHD